MTRRVFDAKVIQFILRSFDLISKVENLLNKIYYPRCMGVDHSDRFVGAQYCNWHGSVVTCLNCCFNEN